MKFFQTTSIDDFFDDPDAVRQYALSLEYPEAPGHYPGKRSADLKEINPEFYHAFCERLFSLFFTETPEDYNVELKFQLIEHQHPDRDSIYNKGWVHLDHNASFAGLIYLNPNADLDTGTAIFKQLKEQEETSEAFFKYKDQMESKNRFFLDGEDKNYEKNMTEYNSQFVETIRFSNVYNRLICFESSQQHAATNLFVSGEPRLTLVYFVKGIKTEQQTNLMKMRNIKL
jgi:hypothetical protein